MRHARIFFCFLGYMFPALDLQADGLILTIAEDGAAAVFDFNREGEATRSEESTTLAATGTARIALVGTQTVGELKCRWVELEVDQEMTFGKKQRSELLFWKFLVPENDLVDSNDPLARVVRILYMKSPADDKPRLITDEDSRRVALWPLQAFIPQSPTKQNRLNDSRSSQNVETVAGTFECKVHTFDSFVDQYLHGPYRIQECRIHRIWENSKSPFGVVAMNIHSEIQEVSIPVTPFAGASDRMTRTSISMVTELRLRSVEAKATSRFPEHK